MQVQIMACLFIFCQLYVAVHTIAHLFNMEWYNNSRQGLYDDLSTILSNKTNLNPVPSASTVSTPKKHIPRNLVWSEIISI